MRSNARTFTPALTGSEVHVWRKSCGVMRPPPRARLTLEAIPSQYWAGEITVSRAREYQILGAFPWHNSDNSSTNVGTCTENPEPPYTGQQTGRWRERSGSNYHSGYRAVLVGEYIYFCTTGRYPTRQSAKQHPVNS